MFVSSGLVRNYCVAMQEGLENLNGLVVAKEAASGNYTKISIVINSSKESIESYSNEGQCFYQLTKKDIVSLMCRLYEIADPPDEVDLSDVVDAILNFEGEAVIPLK